MLTQVGTYAHALFAQKGVELLSVCFSCSTRFLNKKMGANGSKRFGADLESLRKNDPTLTVLNYEQTGLGDEGARALAEALRGNRTLKRLRLGQSGLSALGLQRICRALCDTTVTPCHLRRLDLVNRECSVVHDILYQGHHWVYSWTMQQLPCVSLLSALQAPP